MAEYCTYQDVTDIIPSSIIGTNPGQVASGQVMRIVAKCSARIEYWNNKVPLEQTTVTNEYHQLIGLDRLALERDPVISITTLEVEETSGTWTAKTQGRTSSTDDFFLEDGSWGLVTFHNAPAAGLWCRVTYEMGYATNPEWLRDLCSKMVACDIFKLKTFDEECENMFKYWLDEIREYKKDIREYKDWLKQRKVNAKSLGARWATTPVNELSKIRRWQQ